MIILPNGEVRFEFTDLVREYGSELAEKTWDYVSARCPKADGWIDPATGETGRYLYREKLDWSALMDVSFFGSVCDVADRIKEEEEESGVS